MIVTRIVVRKSKTLNISGKTKGNHKVFSFVVVMNKIYLVSVIFGTHFFILQSSSSLFSNTINAVLYYIIFIVYHFTIWISIVYGKAITIFIDYIVGE